VSDTPTPAPAEQNTEPAGDSGEAASGPARETDNATMAELRILRKQLKERDQKLTAFEQAQAEKARAELTEVERHKQEAAQARAELESTRAEIASEKKANAFKLAAIQAGAKRPDLVLKLADLSTLELDGGKVIGVEALIKGLQKEAPELFSSGQVVAAGSGGGNPATGAPSLSARDIQKMTPAQYREYKADFLSGKIKL
jgi:hypothetical protein